MASAGRVRHRRGSAGLTILHVALLVGGLTLAASVGIPRWFERDVVTLENAALLLAQDLREVQNRAAFQRRPLRVVFLPEGAGYEVRDPGDRLVHATVGDGPFRRVYDRDAVFRGVAIDGLTARAGDSIVYGPRGSVLDGAMVRLSFRGHTRSLHVEAGSGRIHLSGMRQDWRDELD